MPQRIGNPTRRRRHFIREWREFRGMTQQELADQVGRILGRDDIHKGTISKIEGLTQGYTQDSLEAIAEALGAHPGALLTRLPGEADLEIARSQRARA